MISIGEFQNAVVLSANFAMATLKALGE